ncbi:MAG: nitronate monooxygenase [Nisaea sp.]|uniref:NAD(P)H-dependent flavin oxidoreductase n=1 Tax=Nisaea sp. TaxID=2024842 RepID=UPI001B2A3C0A|nr:nitronate monooxygenase [Nisaea sp.]MBO6561798.1 nitronate monooxygenase [Nisaea sp.]
MTFTTDAAARLGICHPIIQGPFGGGLSTVELAAKVSNAGGLGSYGAHVTAPEDLADLTRRLSDATDAPFALNLWVSDHDPGGEHPNAAQFERYYPIFAPYYEELGLPAPALPERFHHRFEDQVEALLEARPPVFSFVFGIPERKILEECRRLGIVTIGAATTLAEAEALDASGVDLIVATGLEAGGHRVSFLAPAEESLTGTFSLVQIAATHVKAPVIAAGGIVDGRGVRASLALGAGAAQLGTAFLACAESGTSEAHRDLLFSEAARDTKLTRSYTGRLARGIRNRWIQEMEVQGKELPPFPVQSWFFGAIKAAALKEGRDDLLSLYAGQSAPNLKHRSASALMDELIADLATARAA